MFGKNLAIVDIETTGMSSQFNRIIEIAIIRVENNKIVDTYTTLVNPQTHVSSFIYNFTGIAEEDLKQAPVFADIKDRVAEILHGATFVAHNVRFDYTFIKNELKRQGIPFKAKTFCTVRLSRRLYPEHRSHSLESIIARHNFSFKSRHRAYDDAYVLWQFLKKIKKTFPKKQVEEAWAALTKSLYSADPGLKDQIDALPEAPGVYLFYDRDGKLLYVGKSTNVSDRVIAHFSEDGQSEKHLTLMREVAAIDYILTAGELGALLTESQLVKKLNPVYNRQLRQKRLVYVLKKETDKDGYLTFKSEACELAQLSRLDDVFRTFNSKTSMKEFLTFFADKYSLCPRLLGLEKGKGACFSSKLGKCKGACAGRESKLMYNARFTIALIENQQFKPWPFDGPVQITEAGDDDRWDIFTFDNWSLIAHENHRGETEEFEPQFDIDTYAILSRHLKKSKGNNLRQVKNQEVENGESTTYTGGLWQKEDMKTEKKLPG